MSESQKRALQELAKRKMRSVSLTPSILFGPQRDFVLSKEQFVAASCSRRAGKSFGIAYKLIEGALEYEGSINPYVTLTRNSGKDIVWPALRDIGRAIGLEMHFKENTGDVAFENKSKIIIRGCEDQRQAEKLRGLKFPRVVIDEAQAFPHYLKDIIDDIISPGLIDYPNSQLLLTGTPNRSCQGVFHDAVHNKGEMLGWDVHEWTLRENTSFAKNGIDIDGWLAALRKRKGWDASNPTYQREYGGIWTRDEDGRVYHYKEALNRYFTWESEDLVDDWEYVLGVDLGWNDPSAFVVVAGSPSLREFWVLDSFQETEMSNIQVAKKIMEYQQDYPISRVVMDTGGYGKSIAEDMKSQYDLPVVAAEKVKKFSYIDQMNSDFRTGAVRILSRPNDVLLTQLGLLQWDEKSLNTGKPKEDRRTPNHTLDAMLYAWRFLRGQGGAWVPEGPEQGTDAWWSAEVERMEQETIDRMEAEDDPEGWWRNL